MCSFYDILSYSRHPICITDEYSEYPHSSVMESFLTGDKDPVLFATRLLTPDSLWPS